MSPENYNQNIYGETYLEFPCDFTFKVMGHATGDFEAVVVTIFNSHLPPKESMDIHTRYSRNHKYLAISVTIKAQSKPQLDAIYQDLSAHEKVLWVL